jgi:3-methylornithyl-N6-L-lysine dehydrogenase
VPTEGKIVTRLITEWILDMEEGCQRRDLELKEKTGLSLLELAAKAAGRNPAELRRLAGDVLVAAVPVTAGLGVIGQFAQSVAAIVRTAGFQCIVTEKSDVDGMYEAYQAGAELIFIADDDRFLAFNTKSHKIGENNQATAAGYVAALEAMMRKKGVSMKDAPVLVLGYGPVGRHAAEILLTKDAKVTVFDKDPFQGKPNRPQDIIHFPYIIEATPQSEWIHKEMISPDALIAAPGIPLGLDGETAELFKNQLVHDMLDIGTATMLAMAL